MLCFLIDRTLNVLKWPVAALLLLVLPELILQFWSTLKVLLSDKWLLFWGGVVLYGFLWKYLFSARLWGSWLPTFLHELCHAVVALLTLHRIRDFHASYNRGGHIQYIGGEGNWLITIAPYVIPSLTLPMLISAPYLQSLEWFWLVFGMGVGFDVISIYRECHSEQTDLQSLGFLFSLLMIPSLNLLTFGAVFLWMEGGSTAVVHAGSALLELGGARFIELTQLLWKQLQELQII